MAHLMQECDGLIVYGLETMKWLSYLEQIDR